MRWLFAFSELGLCAALPSLAAAQPSEPPPSAPEPSDPAASAGAESAQDDRGEAIDVEARSRPRDWLPGSGRPSSVVDRRELEEQLPRSAPDALRYEPGVYVQQTAHGQASPYVRGRTGQQTLLLFDGIRLSNSTFRQGPNQYFFTVDTQSVHSIEVVRGGGSTRYGSDAIGGVVNAVPMEPRVDLAEGLRLHPRAVLRGSTADSSFGFRSQLEGQLDPDHRLLVGFGERWVGRLESAGPVVSPHTGLPPEVPAFADDGRTQLGTGFREMTADGRLVYGLGRGRRLVAAAYLYRQFDAPRTDKCPPPFAPLSECLTIDEQFRTLAYLSYRGDLGWAAERARITLSYQRQHERRLHDRPAAAVQNGARDDVDTMGWTALLQTAPLLLGPAVPLELRYGGDVYLDAIDAHAWTEFTDVEVVIPATRGRYLSGSRYAQGGLFADAKVALGRYLTVRAGARGGGALAQAPADPESGSAAVDQLWPIAVGHVGLEARPFSWLALLVNADRSFRTPNLDDLTARQQTGPGFQFENPELEPERAIALEAGLRVNTAVFQAEIWGYRSTVHGAIARALRDESDCPPATPSCAASWTRLQLVNLGAPATVDGVEGSARAFLPAGFALRATASYAYGQGPNPQPRPADPAEPYDERVPLSRIPPLNGSAEARWQSPIDLYLGAALRWALAQDRLAPTDMSDPRIPAGGTPGFAVLDLRAGYRWGRELFGALVLENLADAAYRYHGSSIQGAGRGLRFHLEGGL